MTLNVNESTIFPPVTALYISGDEKEHSFSFGPNISTIHVMFANGSLSAGDQACDSNKAYTYASARVLCPPPPLFERRLPTPLSL